MRTFLIAHKNKFHLLCCLLVCVFVSACSQSDRIKSDLQAYKKRLTDFTEIDPDQNIPAQTSIALKLAGKAELRKEVEAVSINLREFYAFKECTLSQLIAQRNTALGKMQLPSSRFVYEINLLDEMSRCQALLEQQDGKEDLVNKLKLWTTTKKQQLPLVWSNLITQSEEVYSHITLNSGFISGDVTDNLQATKQAWLFLSQIIEFEQNDISIEDLEYHLQALTEAPLLARKWRTQALLSEQLTSINPILQQYLDTNTCQSPKEEADIVIMRNIFTLFFAEKIQALGGELNKYHYQLSPIIQHFINNPHIPVELRNYFDKHDNIGFERYRKSMQAHIELWQQIFARCN